MAPSSQARSKPVNNVPQTKQARTASKLSPAAKLPPPARGTGQQAPPDLTDSFAATMLRAGSGAVTAASTASAAAALAAALKGGADGAKGGGRAGEPEGKGALQLLGDLIAAVNCKAPGDTALKHASARDIHMESDSESCEDVGDIREESYEKASQRREKNRVAARKCRQKKMAHISRMEDELQGKISENMQLKMQVTAFHALYLQEVQKRERLLAYLRCKVAELGTEGTADNGSLNELIAAMERVTQHEPLPAAIVHPSTEGKHEGEGMGLGLLGGTLLLRGGSAGSAGLHGGLPARNSFTDTGLQQFDAAPALAPPLPTARPKRKVAVRRRSRELQETPAAAPPCQLAAASLPQGGPCAAVDVGPEVPMEGCHAGPLVAAPFAALPPLEWAVGWPSVPAAACEVGMATPLKAAWGGPQGVVAHAMRTDQPAAQLGLDVCEVGPGCMEPEQEGGAAEGGPFQLGHQYHPRFPSGMLEDIELSALASCGMSWQHSGGQSGTLGPLGAEAEAVGPTGTVGEGQGVPDCWATEEVGPSAAVVRGQAGTGSWQAEAVGTSEAGGAGQAAVGCWPPWGFGQLSPPLSQLQSSLSHSLPSIPSIPDLATGKFEVVLVKEETVDGAHAQLPLTLPAPLPPPLPKPLPKPLLPPLPPPLASSQQVCYTQNLQAGSGGSTQEVLHGSPASGSASPDSQPSPISLPPHTPMAGLGDMQWAERGLAPVPAHSNRTAVGTTVPGQGLCGMGVSRRGANNCPCSPFAPLAIMAAGVHMAGDGVQGGVHAHFGHQAFSGAPAAPAPQPFSRAGPECGQYYPRDVHARGLGPSPFPPAECGSYLLATQPSGPVSHGQGVCPLPTQPYGANNHVLGGDRAISPLAHMPTSVSQGQLFSAYWGGSMGTSLSLPLGAEGQAQPLLRRHSSLRLTPLLQLPVTTLSDFGPLSDDLCGLCPSSSDLKALGGGAAEGMQPCHALSSGLVRSPRTRQSI